MKTLKLWKTPRLGTLGKDRYNDVTDSHSSFRVDGGKNEGFRFNSL